MFDICIGTSYNTAFSKHNVIMNRRDIPQCRRKYFVFVNYHQSSARKNQFFTLPTPTATIGCATLRTLWPLSPPTAAASCNMSAMSSQLTLNISKCVWNHQRRGGWKWTCMPMIKTPFYKFTHFKLFVLYNNWRGWYELLLYLLLLNLY